MAVPSVNLPHVKSNCKNVSNSEEVVLMEASTSTHGLIESSANERVLMESFVDGGGSIGSYTEDANNELIIHRDTDCEKEFILGI